MKSREMATLRSFSSRPPRSVGRRSAPTGFRAWRLWAHARPPNRVLGCSVGTASQRADPGDDGLHSSATLRALELPGYSFAFGVEAELVEVFLSGCVLEMWVHRSLQVFGLVIRHQMIHTLETFQPAR